jgi:polyisoprenyl-teichoic acid--peptidoglycan teichoic acid transferase
MNETGKETGKTTEAWPPLKPKKNKTGRVKIFFFTAIFLLIGFTLFASCANVPEQTTSFIDKIPFFGQIRHLAKSSDRQLKNEETGRVNILLLGMGGKGHDGAYLTDTIMLASLDVKNKKVSLLSIPRDLSIPVEGQSDWTKINNINAFAEAKEAGSGGVAISQAVSDILDIPVDYYVRADFDGFKNIIDKIGGVDVNVADILDDYSYPIDGQEDNPDYYARFEHLHIDKGLQHMDGSLALKFARSRHGAGAEGSDFARARRQQLILEATKQKLMTAGILLNPVKLSEIIGELNNHVDTNLQIWEMIKMWSMFKGISRDDIINKVIDNSADGLLYQTINDKGAYVLLPKNGDFQEIKYLAQNIFTVVPPQKKAEVSTESATLEILNGTWVNGLANRVAIDLEKYGFQVVRTGNSSRQNFEKSVIYDLTFGEKINSLTILKEKTKASVTFDLPDWLKTDMAAELAKSDNKERPDFIIVLGQDADKTNSGTANTQ